RSKRCSATSRAGSGTALARSCWHRRPVHRGGTEAIQPPRSPDRGGCVPPARVGRASLLRAVLLGHFRWVPDHLVDDAVVFGLLRGQEEVPVGVAGDPLQRLAAVEGDDLADAVL